jgi:hypothetical protein
MKSVKLNISFSTYTVGEVIELEDNIAAHFIAKEWGVETGEAQTVKPEKVKPKGRQVVSRKIPKG